MPEPPPAPGFRTRAIHAGQEPDPRTGEVVPAISPSTTFAQDGIGRPRGFEYARTGNPTRAALEANLASLEGGARAFAFASGMSATDAALRLLLKSGDHVVCEENVYGGTYRLLTRVLSDAGIRATFVDTSNAKNVEAAVEASTKLVWLETPTNPNLKIVDVTAVVRLARERGLSVAVDNTFATPYLQQPLALGVDLVVHSATKYLGGHSDVVGGCVVLREARHAERLQFLQNAVGAVPSPFDCFLLLRGLKTLALRMDAHNRNAQRVAEFLLSAPGVRRVHYPGLPSHPGHAVAKSQMRGFGGMVSFELADRAAAERFVAKLRLCTFAESLGAVETLVCHPASMTHASMPRELRERAGVTEGLLRVSVGVEDVEDILADLRQALG
ncbi:MAG TPA: cystathionine gamma-synthase [Candidatus Thermoplasmatota archaeon]|nr:cystathionine gamma-synthase [Candidatus Thermoplasmatota archaeon]